VAARFCVRVAFVGKLLRRQRQTGQLATLLGQGGPASCLDAAAQAWLSAQVVAQPDATLTELQTLLRVERREVVSRGSVWRVLHEQGWRRKKKPACHRARTRVHVAPAACGSHRSAGGRKAVSLPR
jgi:transposase